MRSSAPDYQVKSLCAWRMIPSPGPRAAQTAAGSVLGRLVIALAVARGVRTANLVRRAEQREELLALGRAPAAQRSRSHLLGLGLGLLLPGRQSMAGLTGRPDSWTDHMLCHSTPLLERTPRLA